MKKSTLLMVLSLVLALTVGLGTTLAYLTDTDADVNVMTLGNVDILQNEQQWNEDATELEAFENDKPLYPYVGTLGWDKEDVEKGAYRVFTMENVVDKYVTVTNTGKSDAYVRTIIAAEMGEYETVDEFRYKIVGFSHNAVNGKEFKFPGTWDWKDFFVAEIEDHNYMIMVATHQDAVKPEETTIPSLLQIYMNKDCGNEEVEKLDGNGNGKYDVLVLSQAVQTAGFGSAEEALNEAFPMGDNYANVPVWFTGWTADDIGSPGDEWISNNPPSFVPEGAATISSIEELNQLFADGGEAYLTENFSLNDDPIVVSNNTVVTLHMNGKKITGTSTNASASNQIHVKSGATLNLVGEGVVEFTASKPDTDWGEGSANKYPGYASNTIKNEGTVVIDGATVVNHTGHGGASYAIDNYQGATLIVNSGKVIQDGPDGSDVAIRMFANSNTLEDKVVINGGEISGRRAIWLQLPGNDSSKAMKATLEITGGTLTGTSPDVQPAVYSYSYGNSFANTNVTITGGTFNGDVQFSGGYKGDKENVTVTGGTFNGALGRWLTNDGWEDFVKP